MKQRPFVSHAQNFEDVMLHRALRHVTKGFYVDIGADHPTDLSVTKAFYDRNWRGIGLIPQSGWELRPEFSEFDAERRFQVGQIQTRESEVCIAGQILQGLKKPAECPAFGSLCTPKNPLGAPMVSSEGACSAYHRYARS